MHTVPQPNICLLLTIKANKIHYFSNFILVMNSTYFGQVSCPSSGALILYSQQLVFVILVISLSASEVGMVICLLIYYS